MTDSCDRLRARGGWAEDAAAPDCTWPIGPRNTWSNAAYLLAGVALVGLRPGDPPTLVLAAALATLALGSAAYHGWKTRWANRLDWTGMYLVFGALAVHGLVPHHRFTPLVMLTTGGLLALLLAYLVPNVSLDLQMGILFWFSMLPAVLNGNRSLALAGLACFGLAFACWQLDRHRQLGKWGHALWHLLTAPAIALVYLGQPQ